MEGSELAIFIICILKMILDVYLNGNKLDYNKATFPKKWLSKYILLPVLTTYAQELKICIIL